MRVCESVWAGGKCDRVEAMIEQATGLACPGRTGGSCPFVPTPERSQTPDFDFELLVLCGDSVIPKSAAYAAVLLYAVFVLTSPVLSPVFT